MGVLQNEFVFADVARREPVTGRYAGLHHDRAAI
jgi:hypothetical protein